MTNKHIEYIDDVREFKLDRGFTRQDVKDLLATGERRRIPSRGEPKYGRIGKVNGKWAMVVYVENAERVLVLSIQWLHRNPKKWNPHPKGR